MPKSSKSRIFSKKPAYQKSEFKKTYLIPSIVESAASSSSSSQQKEKMTQTILPIIPIVSEPRDNDVGDEWDIDYDNPASVLEEDSIAQSDELDEQIASAIDERDFQRVIGDESGNADRLQRIMGQVQTVIDRGKSNNTLKQYDSKWTNSVQLIKKHLKSDFDPTDLSEEAGKLLPLFLVSVLMFHCEGGIQMPNGELIKGTQCKFTTAVAIRASWSYQFKLIQSEYSSHAWEYRHDLKRWVGNPSRAESVLSYMRGLNRRKKEKGEHQESQRAITESDLKAFYFRLKEMRDQNPHDQKIPMYLAMHLLCVLSFLCLLRAEEALKLRVDQVFLPVGCNDMLEVHVGFRKNKIGHSVFPVPRNDAKPWICPVRAYLDYFGTLAVSIGGTDDDFRAKMFQNVFLIKNFYANGAIDYKDSLKYNGFARELKILLNDIGRRSYMYGCHSFRRGGCQYLSSCGLGFNEICKWGQWSDDVKTSMFRYMMSDVDQHASRIYFMKPIILDN